MRRFEVKSALDSISEKSDNEIALSAAYIRKVANEALSQIKTLEWQVLNKKKQKTKK
jgi:hypothetical protein